MFIKKDLRKIPKILDDAIVVVDENDDDDDGKAEAKDAVDPATRSTKRLKRPDALLDLKLGRRQQEFQGTLTILCQPHYLPKMQHLQSLNLYDCDISNLDDIGMFAKTPLQVLNLGRNPLKELPASLGQLHSLRELWLEDCGLQGDFPDCVLQLPHLKLLRASNNQWTELPSAISKMISLEVLCLDRNQFQTLPSELAQLKNLHSLLVRHNLLTRLPEGVPCANMPLQLLHVSSNQLTHLPDSIVECTTLTHVYANSNQLTALPVGMEQGLPQLERLNVSHNPLATLSPQFVARFGTPDATTGMCETATCCVLLTNTPVLLVEPPVLQDQQVEKEDAAMMDVPGAAATAVEAA
jgi:Leucine-rich repeat (LRR) protein